MVDLLLDLICKNPEFCWQGIKQLAKIINSGFGLMIVGFVLTNLLGNKLTDRFAQRKWERETKAELYKIRYNEGVQFLQSFSETLSAKMVMLHKMLTALANKDFEVLEKIQGKYLESIDDWEPKLWSNRNSLRLLIGEKQADEFLEYQENFQGLVQGCIIRDLFSLHTYNRDARVKTQIYKEALESSFADFGLKTKESEAAEALYKAQESYYELNKRLANYFERLTNKFILKSTSLHLLEIPDFPLKKPG